jgi:molybdopterin synthase sulfur carrier subunit
MKITVKAFASLRTIFPAEISEEFRDGSTIADLVSLLNARYPGLSDELFSPDGRLKPYVNILKNGRNIHFLQGLTTLLDDGDLIALFPPVAGG